MRLLIKKAFDDTWDYREAFIVKTDNNYVQFVDGEIEDNNLRRNFNDVYTIPCMIKEAYEAGKRGEELTITDEEVDWKDLW